MQEIKLVLYGPQTAEGQAELSRLVTAVRAERILRRLEDADCPLRQKLAQLDQIMEQLRADPTKKEEQIS